MTKDACDYYYPNLVAWSGTAGNESLSNSVENKAYCIPSEMFDPTWI